MRAPNEITVAIRAFSDRDEAQHDRAMGSLAVLVAEQDRTIRELAIKISDHETALGTVRAQANLPLAMIVYDRMEKALERMYVRFSGRIFRLSRVFGTTLVSAGRFLGA
ncbi:hypothetical protein [Acetobacter oeni]|uniref:Uncharacterized protein n=1 Tax=Acetobacter oeni TaxID=304077 RepID=A0A511XJT1_9PROT|nr:hypothetical protein [Acetobacter oeni]MBB3883400.1 putative coiled-coil protein SlyX [Acetobacter oeni]NHO19375.1 hypothetical protein [Acetobacter oeni]GBR03943.1 hypothetical protein AA21952_1235 [Acetobacter oeni LMG 21952]GEN63181.1 hypothetical protein AOE01nite_14050 [Acetobacter oeni]